MPTERTIHVVDDDAAVRHSLEQLLESMGFATVSYTTPGNFLLAAPHLLGGCVLLDVKMPGISGLEVQARLRTIGFVQPIIVITGQGDIQTAVLAMKAGAFDFLEKPYEDEVLLAAIEAALAASPDDHIHQAVELGPTDRQAKSARAGSAGRPGCGSVEQGHRLRSWTERPDRRGASSANDGATRDAPARGSDPACGVGDACAAAQAALRRLTAPAQAAAGRAHSFLVMSSCGKRSSHSSTARSTIPTDRGPKSLITPCRLR